MGHKYLVWGIHMGRAIAHDLIRQPDTELVAIADKDKNVLKVGRQLEDSSSVECEYIVSDIEKTNLVELSGNFDVVVSALPARYSYRLAQAAIKSETGFCELGGVVDVTQQCLTLGQEAKNRQISVALDCGLQPGLGMILARKLLYDNPEIKEIGIYVGGMPQKPRPPMYHQNMFSIEGLKHLCHDPIPILENGEIIYQKPFCEPSEFLQVDLLKKYPTKFEGRVEAFLTAGASVAPWTFNSLGVKLFEKTLRWPGFVEFVKDIPQDQFERRVMPHTSIPVNTENPDFVFMRVVGKDLGGKIVGSYELLDEFDSSTGLSAMQKTTGFTTAVIARLLAKGELSRGVSTSEFAIAPSKLGEFLEEIKPYFHIRKN